MTAEPQEAEVKTGERTSVSLPKELLQTLQIHWHDYCSQKREHMSQQDYTELVVKRGLGIEPMEEME